MEFRNTKWFTRIKKIKIKIISIKLIIKEYYHNLKNRTLKKINVKISKNIKIRTSFKILNK